MQRSAIRESGEQAASEAGATRVEREPAADTDVAFVPLGEPMPGHGIGRTVSVGASPEGASLSAAAAAGSAREGNVASGEDR